MKITHTFSTLLGVVRLSSCHQLAQQAVEPIPPPSPETLSKPLPAAAEAYYTLPKPITE